jgi:hypothetical protein
MTLEFLVIIKSVRASVCGVKQHKSPLPRHLGYTHLSFKTLCLNLILPAHLAYPFGSLSCQTTSDALSSTKLYKNYLGRLIHISSGQR